VLAGVLAQTCNSLHRYSGSSKCNAKHLVDRAGGFNNFGEEDDPGEEDDLGEEDNLGEEGG